MSPASPRVSVVMIFWNAQQFMQEAVASVLAQTYRRWELLLVDDGSTDGSTALARKCAASYPERIRYLAHEGNAHRGAAATRNLGMAAARGQYVAFLDADDVYLPHKLEEQVALLDHMPDVAMLYGRTELWYGWDGTAAPDKMTAAAPHLDRRYPPPTLAVHLLQNEVYYPCTCSTLIRHSAIEAVGGCDERFASTYEDMTLFLKICANFDVFVSSTCWDRYRRHPGSTWSRTIRSGAFRHGRPNPVRHEFLLWVEEYLRERSGGLAPLRAALAEQLRPYSRSTLSDTMHNAKANLLHLATRFVQRTVPEPARQVVRRWLRTLRRRAFRFGSFRRLEPVSSFFGYDRGSPVDRYYIERFLAAHAADVRGRVLEVEEDTYTRRFGGGRVTHSDVLYLTPEYDEATIVADLTDGDGIPSASFDCVILTQTLQYIYDVEAAVRTLYRILKPGGVVLATVPGISETRTDPSGATWHWSFTPHSARAAFEAAFPADAVAVASHGNVLAACAFLQGLAAEELRPRELDHHDPSYVVSVTVRAVKPEGV